MMDKILEFLNQYKVCFEIFQTVCLGTMGLIISYVGLKINKRALKLSELQYEYTKYSNLPLWVINDNPSGIKNVGTQIKEGNLYFKEYIKIKNFFIPVRNKTLEPICYDNTNCLFLIEFKNYDSFNSVITKLAANLFNEQYYDIFLDATINYTDACGTRNRSSFFRLDLKRRTFIPINGADVYHEYECGFINLEYCKMLYDERPINWEKNLLSYFDSNCKSVINSYYEM